MKTERALQNSFWTDYNLASRQLDKQSQNFFTVQLQGMVNLGEKLSSGIFLVP